MCSLHWKNLLSELDKIQKVTIFYVKIHFQVVLFVTVGIKTA